MAQITYNGVALPYSDFTHFQQVVVMDDSRTDWYCTQFDITVQSIINPQYISIATGASKLTSPSDMMVVLRSLLMKPRRTLSVKTNGFELIPQVQAGNAGEVDAQNGPTPKYCNIVMLTNTTFLIEYSISAKYWENNSYHVTDAGLSNTNLAGNTVLYNRWSESVDIDECVFSTRRREGKYIIRSDNVLGLLADQVRASMATTSVPPKYTRQSAHYKVSPDGLGIEYSFVDKQLYRELPPGAYKAEGYYTEATAKKYTSNIRVAAIHIKLEGDPVTSTTSLLDTALYIAATKLRIRGRQINNKNNLVESADVRMGLYNNSAEANIKVFIPIAGAKSVFNINAFNGITPKMPKISGPTREYPPYGKTDFSNKLLQAAAYYDPSLTGTKLNGLANNQLTDGLAPGTAGKDLEV